MFLTSYAASTWFRRWDEHGWEQVAPPDGTAVPGGTASYVHSTDGLSCGYGELTATETANTTGLSGFTRWGEPGAGARMPLMEFMDSLTCGSNGCSGD